MSHVTQTGCTRCMRIRPRLSRMICGRALTASPPSMRSSKSSALRYACRRHMCVRETAKENISVHVCTCIQTASLPSMRSSTSSAPRYVCKRHMCVKENTKENISVHVYTCIHVCNTRVYTCVRIQTASLPSMRSSKSSALGCV